MWDALGVIRAAERFFAGLGHLALWAALYQVGALVVAGALLGVDLLGSGSGWAAMGGVGLVAMSTYLKDRIKLRSRHLDPADPVAHPSRAAFLRANALRVRALMVTALVAGSAMLGVVHPVLTLVGPAAWIGVIWYGRPRAGDARRPKDRLIVKNGIVALTIGGMVWTVALVERGAGVHWAPAAWVLAAVVAQVFCDAIVCDIDDHEADARFGTRTISVVWGNAAAWGYAASAQLLAIVLALKATMENEVGSLPALILGAGGIAGLILTHALPAGTRRDATDLKLAVIGLAVLIVRL